MSIITSGLQGLLDILFNVTGDLGIAIVLVTVLVKCALMPLSLRQKKSMQRQGELSATIEELKKKYKNNPEELERNMQKYSVDSIKGIAGCLSMFIQMPIIYGLFNAFRNMPAVGSILIPWVSSLNVYDNYFVIPLIYIVVMVAPNLISYIPYLNVKSKAVINKTAMISTVIMAIIFTARTPVGLGLYFITSSLCSLLEDVIYRIYTKRKAYVM